MDLLPDWAPNVHPMVVHFPIALLFAAVLLDGLALLWRKVEGLRIGAVAVFVLGALGALASFLTGRAAADDMLFSAAADPLVTDHADWAEWTVWFFGIYALVRLGVLWWDRQGRPALWIPLFLVGAGGLFLVFETAEHGAQLVFEQGVGVQAVERLEAMVAAQQEAQDRARAQAAGPVAAEDGSWRWTPGALAAEGLAEGFRWLAGDAAALAPEARPQAAGDTALALQANGQAAFFVFDHPLRSIQADVALNLDGFDGALMIVHHVRDDRNYLFTSIEKGAMRQGRVQDGQVTLMGEHAFEGAGWQTFRVVADKTHFRAYAGGTMVTHGHGAEPEPGPVGLRLDGTGTVLLGRMAVQSLRS